MLKQRFAFFIRWPRHAPAPTCEGCVDEGKRYLKSSGCTKSNFGKEISKKIWLALIKGNKRWLFSFFGRSGSVCRLWQEKETINGNSTAFTPKDSPPWLAVLQQSAVFLWLPADIRQAKTERLDLKKQQAKGLWESFNFCQAFCVWHVHRGPSFLKFKLPVGGNFKEEPPESTGSFIKERQVHRQAGSRQRAGREEEIHSSSDSKGCVCCTSGEVGGGG